MGYMDFENRSFTSFLFCGRDKAAMTADARSNAKNLAKSSFSVSAVINCQENHAVLVKSLNVTLVPV